MPYFTHLLGPAVDAGGGNPQTQLTRHLSITRALIDELPSCAFFKQALDPSINEGLAVAHGLAFQDRGFHVSPQYTFQVDCRRDPSAIWDAMHHKVRQHIRRAEQKCSIVSISDPEFFVQFYLKNIVKSGRSNRMDFRQFPTLFSECRSRLSGDVLGAMRPDGSYAAMVFLVWGHGVMYYLLSTRDNNSSDSGSVNLLLWSAMNRANQLKVNFDLDGVYTSGTARFLSGFGGQIRTRLVVRRAQPVYGALQCLKKTLNRDNDYDHYT